MAAQQMMTGIPDPVA